MIKWFRRLPVDADADRKVAARLASRVRAHRGRMSFRNTMPTPARTRGTASVVIRCGPLAMLVLLMFACGNQVPGGVADSPTTPSTDIPTTSSTRAPATEGTGPEQPAPAGAGPPAIDIASLPIGGRPDDDTTGNPCVRGSWV